MFGWWCNPKHQPNLVQLYFMEKFACQLAQGERADSLSDQVAALFSIKYFQNFFNSEGFGIRKRTSIWNSPNMQDETLPCLGEPFPISLPEKIEWKLQFFMKQKLWKNSKFSMQYFAGNNYIMNAGNTYCMYNSHGPCTMYFAHVLLWTTIIILRKKWACLDNNVRQSKAVH
jgi:hypothetical protein